MCPVQTVTHVSGRSPDQQTTLLPTQRKTTGHARCARKTQLTVLTAEYWQSHSVPARFFRKELFYGTTISTHGVILSNQ